mmetsp:Transcript_45377/g.106550  ORF Transcript_45377/g.106550 Transcript_45377/m.106550 type:complete len:215 (-) Transcript_45377:234-878(-)
MTRGGLGCTLRGRFRGRWWRWCWGCTRKTTSSAALAARWPRSHVWLRLLRSSLPRERRRGMRRRWRRRLTGKASLRLTRTKLRRSKLPQPSLQRTEPRPYAGQLFGSQPSPACPKRRSSLSRRTRRRAAPSMACSLMSLRSRPTRTLSAESRPSTSQASWVRSTWPRCLSSLARTRARKTSTTAPRATRALQEARCSPPSTSLPPRLLLPPSDF